MKPRGALVRVGCMLALGLALSGCGKSGPRAPNTGWLYFDDGHSDTAQIVKPDGTTEDLTYPLSPLMPSALYAIPSGYSNAGDLIVLSSVTMGGADHVSLLQPDGVQIGTLIEPGPIVSVTVAPPGVAHAGTIYLAVATGQDESGPGRLVEIPPDFGTQKMVPVPPAPDDVIVVPHGLPGAGTVYVESEGDLIEGGGELTAFNPSGQAHTVTCQPVCHDMILAGRGQPAAGTVYAFTRGLGDASNALLIVHPDGTSQQVPLPEDAGSPLMGPVGAPNAGALYLSPGGNNADTEPSLEYTPVGRLLTLPDGEFLGIAPKGAPNAGTVWLRTVTDANQQVNEISPTGLEGAQPVVTADKVDTTAFVTPAGTPEAGTIFVTTEVDATNMEQIVMVTPNHVATPYPFGQPGDVFGEVAPAGAANAGRLYASNASAPTNMLTVLQPGAAPRQIPTVAAPVYLSIIGDAAITSP